MEDNNQNLNENIPEEENKETAENVETTAQNLEETITDEERLKDIDVNHYFKKWFVKQNVKQAILIYGILLIIIFNFLDDFLFRIIGATTFIIVLAVALIIDIAYIVIAKKAKTSLEDREKYFLCSYECNKMNKYYEIFEEERDKKHEFTKKSKFVNLWSNIVDYVLVVILAIFTVVFVFTVVLFPADVEQESMKPTLESGDKVLVFHTKKFERGDIIVFEFDYDIQANICEEYELLIKRVIAKPGDTFECVNGTIYINGEKLEENYLGNIETDSYTLESVINKNVNASEIKALMGETNVIPDGYYLVLGDNRLVSRDSEEFGLVHFSQMKGKVKFYKNDSGWSKVN